MALPSPAAQAILQSIQNTATAYADGIPGSREQLLGLSQALISSLELPSEAIQRMGWAEVCDAEAPDGLTRLMNVAWKSCSVPHGS